MLVVTGRLTKHRMSECPVLAQADMGCENFKINFGYGIFSVRHPLALTLLC